MNRPCCFAIARLFFKVFVLAACIQSAAASIDHLSPQKTEHSVYGHLRLLQRRRYVPVVAALAALQVLKEDKNTGRWRAIAKATQKWFYRNP